MDIYPPVMWSPGLYVLWPYLYHPLIDPLFLVWMFRDDLSLVDDFGDFARRLSSQFYCSYMAVELLVRTGTVGDLVWFLLDNGLSHDRFLQLCI